MTGSVIVAPFPTALRCFSPVYFMRSYWHCRVPSKAIPPPLFVAAAMLFSLAGCRLALLAQSHPDVTSGTSVAVRAGFEPLTVQQSPVYRQAVRLYACRDYRGALALLDRLLAAPNRTPDERAFLRRQVEICRAAQHGGVQAFRSSGVQGAIPARHTAARAPELAD